MSRRELWQTVIDIVEALTPTNADALGVRITDVEINLPVEIVLRTTEVGFRVLIDAPVWRQQAGIELQKGRLAMRLHEEMREVMSEEMREETHE
jgi:hypothetical protein